MAEVSTLFNGCQIGKETTPGTGVAASKILNYLSLQPTFWGGGFNTMVPLGQKAAAGAMPGLDFSTWALSGEVGSYSELIYPFCGIFSNVTPTTVDTSAKLWTFAPLPRAEDTIATYTIETGSPVRAQKSTYLLFTGIDLSFNRTDGVKVTGGAAVGQAIQDNITLTATPTSVEDQPILPTHLDVFVDSTSANIGTTKLTRDFDANFSYDSARSAIWPINSTLGSYASHVETMPTCTIELTMEADTQGMGFLPTARLGSIQYVRLSAVSTVLAGAATAKYQLQIDIAGKITDIKGPDDSGGVKAVHYTFTGVNDPAWGTGKYLSIGLQNKTAAL